jgi:hypothetical protein
MMVDKGMIFCSPHRMKLLPSFAWKTTTSNGKRVSRLWPRKVNLYLVPLILNLLQGVMLWQIKRLSNLEMARCQNTQPHIVETHQAWSQQTHYSCQRGTGLCPRSHLKWGNRSQPCWIPPSQQESRNRWNNFGRNFLVDRV